MSSEIRWIYSMNPMNLNSISTISFLFSSKQTVFSLLIEQPTYADSNISNSVRSNNFQTQRACRNRQPAHVPGVVVTNFWMSRKYNNLSLMVDDMDQMIVSNNIDLPYPFEPDHAECSLTWKWAKNLIKVLFETKLIVHASSIFDSVGPQC